MVMVRITERLVAEEAAVEAVRVCPKCRRAIYRGASDHAEGCLARATVLARFEPSCCGGGVCMTNLEWCQTLAAELSACGIVAAVRRESALCWVNREVARGVKGEVDE